jgi:hypothetical protein
MLYAKQHFISQLCAQILVESEAGWRSLNLERAQGDNVTAVAVRLLPVSNGGRMESDPA